MNIFKNLYVIFSEDKSYQIDVQERIKNGNVTQFMLQKCFQE
jgi:hypothetical protein